MVKDGIQRDAAGGKWKRMRFKAHKVWVAVNPDGEPLIQDGRATITYRLDQPHRYRVRPDRLRSLDDGPAGDAASFPAGRPSKATGTKRSKPAGQQAKVVEIFTDGACSGNPGPAGIGVVLRYGTRRKEISMPIGTATNNIAELRAIEEGLKAVKNRRLPVVVYTDSSYAHGLLTRGWKAKANAELVDRLRRLAAGFADLRIEKVPGHAGLEENERADRLAVRAITGGPVDTP